MNESVVPGSADGHGLVLAAHPHQELDDAGGVHQRLAAVGAAVREVARLLEEVLRRRRREQHHLHVVRVVRVRRVVRRRRALAAEEEFESESDSQTNT